MAALFVGNALRRGKPSMSGKTYAYSSIGQEGNCSEVSTCKKICSTLSMARYAAYSVTDRDGPGADNRTSWPTVLSR